MRRIVGWSFGGVALLGVAGCASAAPPPAAAPAPGAAVAAPPPPPPVVQVAPESPPAPVAAAPMPLEASDRGSFGRGGARARARGDLVSAQRELEASADDCRAACRALGSMDRAAGQLCGLAASSDDARVCDDSKARVLSARARVRGACGACPAGPSVDPSAPVPSP